MKHHLLAIALATTLPFGASAATLDFVAEAAGNERGVADGSVIIFDGLPVTFTSSHFAYFDDLSGGRPAGLGVCQVLDGPPGTGNCNPSNDDNITFGEWVQLGFGRVLDSFQVTSFYNEDHNSLVGSLETLLISINGGALTQFTFADALANVFTDVSTIRFQHDDAAAAGSTTGFQFYVGGATAIPTPVPLPAAGLMLIAGLAGLGALRARRGRV